MSYLDFLSGKRVDYGSHGFDVAESDLHPKLFPFQRAIVRWALAKGRAAIFADCGLGKTPMQLEWARRCCEHTDKPTLILAPLAVSEQTAREGEKFAIPVKRVRSGAEVGEGINITNYELLRHFDPESFGAVVLDESSILKSYDGATRRALTEFGKAIPYRLACTATPAPNDLAELTNHAEFLEVMSGKELLAVYFTQDGNTTHKWRLKRHAEQPFWKWLSTWSVALRHPRDVDLDQPGFDLPSLRWREHIVNAGKPLDGYLFEVEVQGLTERRDARRASLPARVERAAELVAAEPDEQWLLWCDLNAESEALTKAIPGAVEVRGTDSPEHKAAALLGFAAGEVQILVSKPSIAGHGMNFQSCARMAFVGLSDSYEQLYQATRRCWRFGQKRPVEAHIITSSAEGAVRANVLRKEKQASAMFDALVQHVAIYQLDRTTRQEEAMNANEATGDGWRLLLGDCVDRVSEIEDESVGMTIFSPPFPGMYAYTNTARDMGNVKDSSELLEHFGYLIPELLRVTMPGRMCCIHLTQEPVFKKDAGHVGLRDFRGSVIQAMTDDGWIYYGEVTIDKNPQVKASRTKEQTLLFKTLSTDSANCRPALADYLMLFRKPGQNPKPIASGMHKKYNAGKGWITPEEWIEWAAPVWYRAVDGYPGGIRETDVLNVRAARDEKDERHLCPLQLGVIERAVKLWSNPGDLVLSPFAGIASEGFQAVRFSRRFVGIELKESYWREGARNLRSAEMEREQATLFDMPAELPEAACS